MGKIFNSLEDDRKYGCELIITTHDFYFYIFYIDRLIFIWKIYVVNFESIFIKIIFIISEMVETYVF